MRCLLEIFTHYSILCAVYMLCNITASDYPEKALQVRKIKDSFLSDQITFYPLSMRPRSLIATFPPGHCAMIIAVVICQSCKMMFVLSKQKTKSVHNSKNW